MSARKGVFRLRDLYNIEQIMTKLDKPFPNGKNDHRRGIDFIGVTVGFVVHDGHGRFLLHKRSKNCRDEQGRWDNGGGAHEFGHDLTDTLRRELKEEHGTDALDIRFLCVTDSHRKLSDGTPTHWVGVTYAVQVDPKQLINNEPYKIDDFGWFKWGKLPTPLHSTLMERLEAAHAAGII